MQTGPVKSTLQWAHCLLSARNTPTDSRRPERAEGTQLLPTLSSTELLDNTTLCAHPRNSNLCCWLSASFFLCSRTESRVPAAPREAGFKAAQGLNYPGDLALPLPATRFLPRKRVICHFSRFSQPAWITHGLRRSDSNSTPS